MLKPEKKLKERKIEEEEEKEKSEKSGVRRSNLKAKSAEKFLEIRSITLHEW